MLHRHILPLITFLVLVLAAATPARADVVQLFSPGELTPPLVTTDYPNIPPGFVGSILTPPLVVFAGAGTVTFNTGVPAAAGGRLLRFNQGVGFFGDFAAGTELLVTEGLVGVPSGPLTISFSIPILEFGLSAQNSFFESGETSTFTFSLFNGATLLGTFSRSGLDDSGLFFLGARAILGQSITHITISGASTIDDPEAQNNFAIGPVQFQPVPEPATMLLLGAGLAGLAGARWRKRRQVKTE